jgi:hypothetical protein
LIFVSHSLGGLIVKYVSILCEFVPGDCLQDVSKALIKAQLNHPKYGTIKDAARGLMFFGTPHRGGNGVSLGKVRIQPVFRVMVYLTVIRLPPELLDVCPTHQGITFYWP